MIINKFGPLKEASIKLGNMNIFYGKNGHGKTFVSYALYGMYRTLIQSNYNIVNPNNVQYSENEVIFRINKELLLKNIAESAIKNINTDIKNILKKTFSSPEVVSNQDTHIAITDEDIISLFNDKFEDISNSYLAVNGSKIFHFLYSVSLNKDKEFEFHFFITTGVSVQDDTKNETINVQQANTDTSRFVFQTINQLIIKYIYSIKNILYFPAERSGMHVFLNEINKNRSNKIGQLSDQKPVKYPLPISQYLIYLNYISDYYNYFYQDDFVSAERWEIWSDFLKNIIQGKFETQDFEIYYRKLYGKINKDKKTKYSTQKLPFNIISSSLKTIYGLDFYIQNEFTKNDILFIDEPEMNLDPEKQVQLSKILLKLSEVGIKVVISTHSDFILRYFTNKSLEKTLADKDTFNSIQIFHFQNGTIDTVDASDLSQNYFETYDLEYEKLQNEFYNLIDKL